MASSLDNSFQFRKLSEALEEVSLEPIFKEPLKDSQSPQESADHSSLAVSVLCSKWKKCPDCDGVVHVVKRSEDKGKHLFY